MLTKSRKVKLYFNLLLQPWKIVTFWIAFVSLIGGSFYAGDPTWDFGSVSIMSALTFLFAPWCVGAFYSVIAKRKMSLEFFFAVIAWLFTVLISYEVYVLLKTGFEAEATTENFIISSVIFILAGLFWNLGFDERKGIDFEFRNDKWPNIPKSTSIRKISLVGLPILIVYGFLLWRLINEN